jgi:hypothetical protein
MTATQYWIGKLAVVEWALVTLDGTAVDDAAVTGTVTLPDGTTAPMTVDTPATGSGDPYRASYDPGTAGLHAYRVVASGTLDDAEEGTFIVRPSLTGAPTITTDTATAIGMIRLLISDVNVADPVFTDAEVGAFYLFEGSNVRLGAAQALDTLASNEALVSKVITTLDLQTDGAKVAAELRARAKTLRDTAADYTADGTLFAMDIVEWRPDRWWPREQTEIDVSGWCP